MLTRKEIERLEEARNSLLTNLKLKLQFQILIKVIIVALSVFFLAEFKINFVDMYFMSTKVELLLSMLLYVAAVIVAAMATCNGIVDYNEYRYMVIKVRTKYNKY